jgi:hypothetical protein
VSPKRLIATGAALTVVGLAVAGTAPVLAGSGASTQQAVGGAVVLLGWVTLGWGVHQFGRARED